MEVLTQSTGLTASGVRSAAGDATAVTNAAAARAANTRALRISALNPPRLALEAAQMQLQPAVCTDTRHRRLWIEDVNRLRTRRRAANGHGLIDRPIPEVDRRDFKSRVLRQLVHQHQQPFRLHTRYVGQPRGVQMQIRTYLEQARQLRGERVGLLELLRQRAVQSYRAQQTRRRAHRARVRAQEVIGAAVDPAS